MSVRVAIKPSSRSLDSFEFEQVSLLKIDVERFENEVLDGAVDTIRRNRPRDPPSRSWVVKTTRRRQPRSSIGSHVTWRKLETLGYTVTPVFKHDYLALPNPS